MSEDKQTYTIEWHSADEPPKTDKYILLSFANYSLVSVGRYEGNEEEGGNYYEGDDERSLASYGLIVNAWSELPPRYED